MDPSDPTTACLIVAEALHGAGLRGSLYGGLALAAFGEPRETKDADFVVAGVAPEALVSALEAAGHMAAISFDWTRFGGNEVARVSLLGGDSTTGLNVADLVQPRSARYATLVLERSLCGELRGQTISIVLPEDFVLLKLLSTRDRDLEDAASVVGGAGGPTRPRFDWRGSRTPREGDLRLRRLRPPETTARLAHLRARGGCG